jgi:hypothetical protein
MAMSIDPKATELTGPVLAETAQGHPDGVLYMNQLWELVQQAAGPLTVVLRTDTRIFTGVPVAAFWRRGYDEWGNGGRSKYHSELVFDLPDEVVRRIQQDHAEQILSKFFGVQLLAEIPQAFRGEAHLDGKREVVPSGKHYMSTVVTDWDELRTAIQETAEHGWDLLTHAAVRLWWRDATSARVVDDRLEVYISPYLERTLVSWWGKALTEQGFIGLR